MTDPQVPPSPAPNLSELGQRAAVFTFISKRFAELAADATTEFREEMLQRHKKDGVKSIATSLNGAKVVAWTVREATKPGKLEVSDRAAFTDYVAANHPDNFEWVATVRPAFEKLLLANGVHDPKTGTVVNPETGQVIEGVRWVPSPPPSSIAPKWEKSADDLVMEFLRDGAGAEYFGALELPAGGEG